MRRFFVLVVLLVPLMSHSADAAEAPDWFAGASPPITALPLGALGYAPAEDGRGNELVYSTPSSPALDQLVVQQVNVFTGVTRTRPLPSEHCRIEVASPDRILVDCSAVGDGTALYLGRWDSDVWTPTPGLPQGLAQSEDSVPVFAAVRASWATVQFTPYHGSTDTLYLSLADGRMLRDVDVGPRAVADLDQATLARPLCKPISRTVGFGFQYVKPWAVRQLGGKHPGWALDRCGRRRHQLVLSAFPLLTSKRLVWNDGTHGYARDLRTGRTQRFACDGGGCGAVTFVGRYATWNGYPDGYVRDLVRKRTTRVHVPGSYVMLRVIGGRVLASVRLPGTAAPGASGVVQVPK